MKKMFSVIFFFCFFRNLPAQQFTYIGIDAGICQDIYTVSDEGDLLTVKHVLSGVVGGYISQEINYYLAAETGVYVHEYYDGFAFKSDPIYASSNALTAVQIPVRLKCNIDLYQDKIRLYTKAGYNFCINNNYNTTAGRYGIHSGGISYADTIHTNFHKTFPLLESSLGLDFWLFHSLSLNVSFTYYMGFRKIIEGDITYSQNGNDYRGFTTQKGDYLKYAVALQYPISRFWTK